MAQPRCGGGGEVRLSNRLRDEADQEATRAKTRRCASWRWAGRTGAPSHATNLLADSWRGSPTLARSCSTRWKLLLRLRCRSARRACRQMAEFGNARKRGFLKARKEMALLDLVRPLNALMENEATDSINWHSPLKDMDI